MSKFFHPLLVLIASATDSELAKCVEYLKRENEVLRARLPKRIHTTKEDRKKLLEAGRGLGRAIEELISITKYTDEFVKSAKASGAKPIALPVQSPNLNGRCERFIGTLKGECLHRFLIFGKQRLDYLVKEFLSFHNHTRSHSSRECLPPVRAIPGTVVSLSISDVEVRSHLDGLVKSFVRRAA